MDQCSTLNNVLNDFHIKANCVDFHKNDNYFYYDLVLAPTAKVRDIQRYMDEISLAIKSPGKPTLKVLHDKGVVRMEFVTKRTNRLNLFEFFETVNIPSGDVMCLLGQDIMGNQVWMDLAKNPHMVIAGTTGSGKSTLVHNIIANLLNYNETFIYMLDPKRIEFSKYESKIKNVKVGYTYLDAVEILDDLLATMNRRYDLLRQGVSPDRIPYCILIVDEFADLIMQDQDDVFYTKLCTLAQKCRAARISIVLATQRPSVDIINGTIKANFPARIACRVASGVDSRIVLDTSGAENLLGNGDALLRDNTRYIERFQVAYTDADEVCSFFGNAS
jgi:S-DNA-T family DNA segregation ATPase FtsK/SpoIIIE